MKLKAIVSAAAVIALLGTISVSAYALISGGGWNSKMAEIFDADEQIQEQLVNDGMSKEVNLSVTDNGVTMDVLQTIADENMVYILLKFSSEDERLLQCENFDNTWDALKIEGYISPFDYSEPKTERRPDNVLTGNRDTNMVNDSMETITDENGKTIHQFYYAVQLHNDYKQDYNGREITLSFRDLGACQSKAADFATIIEGNWEASWVLEYTDHTRTYDLNKTVEVNGIDVLVKSLEISPLAMNIVIDGESAKALNADGLENHPLREGDFADINRILDYVSFIPVLENGDFNSADIRGGGGLDDYSTQVVFTKILDLDKLVGIKAVCAAFPEYNFEFSLTDSQY